MAVVTDPDNLDRYQVVVDSFGEKISIRGLGTIRSAQASDGDVIDGTTFDSPGADFVTDTVIAGDVLTLISDENIGHYTVASVTDLNTLVINETFPNIGDTSTTVTYRVNAVGVAGGASPNVADGVNWQALYSFLKEEWRTLTGGLGNAPDLNKFNFPIVSITREQFEIGDAAPTRSSAWDFFDSTSRNLMRTGGWSTVDANGFIKEIYSGIVTLGLLDADAQVYYQQHDTDTDPIDFVLTGVVDQSIKTFDEVTGPDAGTGFAVTTSNDIARNDGGDWSTEPYEVGGLLTITNSENALENDGTYRILTIGAGVDGSVTVESEDGTDQAPLTNNAADTTMRIAVENRKFLKLKVRKKGRSYAQSELSDIGVVTLENLVNRFPLTHTSDPAILLDDGQMAGDPAAAQLVFTGVATHTSLADGVTSVEAADGTFTFTSATAVFDSVARTVQTLQPGDSLEIVSGATDVGFFEIKSIDSSTVLTCFTEPTTVFTGGESTITFIAHTRSIDNGAANATLADATGVTGTLTSATSTFDVATGLGENQVNAGDMVLVSAGTAIVLGAYKVISRDSATVLTLDTTDQIFSGETNQTYRVVEPGMYFQFKTETATECTDTVTFNDDGGAPAANRPTILRAAGNFTTDGFVIGGTAVVTLANSAVNDGSYSIQDIITTSTTDDTLVLQLTDTNIIDDASDTTAVINGENGFIRVLNSESFSFNWRLFGNGGSLSQTFQFIQRALRRGRAGTETAGEADIDESSVVRRGDIQELLMSFASPNGTTLNLFIDNLLATEFNNVTKEDILGNSQNFAFIAGITINLNANLTNDTSAKVTVYFTDPDEVVNGNEFGTAGAIIVQDDVPANMEFTTPLSNPISVSFDFDNNVQGGRNPVNPANITIVASGLEAAQYIQATGSIARQNENVFSLTSALERNFNNP